MSEDDDTEQEKKSFIEWLESYDHPRTNEHSRDVILRPTKDKPGVYWVTNSSARLVVERNEKCYEMLCFERGTGHHESKPGDIVVEGAWPMRLSRHGLWLTQQQSSKERSK